MKGTATALAKEPDETPKRDHGGNEMNRCPIHKGYMGQKEPTYRNCQYCDYIWLKSPRNK